MTKETSTISLKNMCINNLVIEVINLKPLIKNSEGKDEHQIILANTGNNS